MARIRSSLPDLPASILNFLDRRSLLRQFNRRLSCGDGPLQKIDPFVELIELSAQLLNRGIVHDSRGSALDALGECPGDRTQDPDEYQADGDNPGKVNYCEFVHYCRPHVGAVVSLIPSAAAVTTYPRNPTFQVRPNLPAGAGCVHVNL